MRDLEQRVWTEAYVIELRRAAPHASDIFQLGKACRAYADQVLQEYREGIALAQLSPRPARGDADQ